MSLRIIKKEVVQEVAVRKCDWPDCDDFADEYRYDKIKELIDRDIYLEIDLCPRHSTELRRHIECAFGEPPRETTLMEELSKDDCTISSLVACQYDYDCTKVLRVNEKVSFRMSDVDEFMGKLLQLDGAREVVRKIITNDITSRVEAFEKQRRKSREIIGKLFDLEL